MSHYADLREACCAANRRLPELGLVDLTFGNVSVASPDKTAIAIKPSGVDYAKLTPGDIVIVDLAGNTIEGALRPSSDTPTHAHLIRTFPGVFSVVHTHSRHATAWAQAGHGIPCLGTTHADYFRGEVPATRPLAPAEIEGEYELETGRVIVERFRDIDPLEVPAVLVHGHGPFAWGPTAEKAVETAHALEIIAQMTLHALLLRPNSPSIDSVLLDKHFQRKHGPAAYYGQTR
jgi:L-ribulose-5-phosphate 4-epimerase